MQVDIITLFPELCRVPLGESMMGRAQETGALEFTFTTCVTGPPTGITSSTTRPSAVARAWS